MDIYSNKLLSQYNNRQQNYQQAQYNFQNNILLQNHLSDFQIQQIKQLQQAQELKKLEKINELEKSFNPDKLKQIIIRPQKITKSNPEILEKWSEYKKQYDSDINSYWKDRHNKPYKNILKNEDYTKKIESVRDLIVHRVTATDKLGVDKEYKDLQAKLEKQNNELKIIYSTSNQTEHKKKFDYNHVYKFKINFDPKDTKIDHDSLKQNRIEYYKSQQKLMEEQKHKKDLIIESLIKNGIFNKDELISAKIINNPEPKPEKSEEKSDKKHHHHHHKTKSKKEQYLERQSKN